MTVCVGASRATASMGSTTASCQTRLTIAKGSPDSLTVESTELTNPYAQVIRAALDLSLISN
jgi:hypothetical protein